MNDKISCKNCKFSNHVDCRCLRHSMFVPVTPEPAKPNVKLIAHALRKDGGQYKLSTGMYESEEHARKVLGDCLHSWPAVPNKDGFYEAEVLSDE